MTKVRMVVSDKEQTLIQKARQLTKLEAKRAAAVELLDNIDGAIARVRGEISTLIQPVIPAAPPSA